MNDAKAGGRATLKQGYIKSSPVSEEIVRRVPAAPAIPSGFEGAGLPTSLGAGLTSIPIFRLSLRRREGDGLGGNREAGAAVAVVRRDGAGEAGRGPPSRSGGKSGW